MTTPRQLDLFAPGRPLRSRGRPPHCVTEQTTARVVAMRAAGYSERAIAANLRVAQNTVAKYYGQRRPRR